MTSGPSHENPHKIMEDTFSAAYAPDAEVTVMPMGVNELIDGTQENGCRLGVFRPNIDADYSKVTFNVHVWYPSSDTGELDHSHREFVVGGDADHPVGFEVLSREPLRKRDLSEDELAELAQRIQGTTFH